MVPSRAFSLGCWPSPHSSSGAAVCASLCPAATLPEQPENAVSQPVGWALGIVTNDEDSISQMAEETIIFVSAIVKIPYLLNHQWYN